MLLNGAKTIVERRGLLRTVLLLALNVLFRGRFGRPCRDHAGRREPPIVH